MTRLNIGDVVIDNFGREGVVLSAERRPSIKWLTQQDDVRLRNVTGPWWKVLPLDGGAVIVPDKLGTFVRRATIDDLLVLSDSQQTDHAGQVTLIELVREVRSKNKARRPNTRLQPIARKTRSG